MRRIRTGWIIPTLALLAGSGLALAQAGPDQFGVQCCQVLQIPAAAFTPRSSTVQYEYLAPGYLYLTALGTQAANQLWAPVFLPTGARVQELGISYYDAESAHDITATLRGYTHGTPDTGGSPSAIAVVSAASSGCCGTGYASTPADHTIRNDAAHDPDAAQWVVTIDYPLASQDLGFKGVDIRWARQVSPSPGSPTFADVPPSDGAFAFVEALVASGVTAGCGGGNYCPDAPLTRRQMAVFLSKALGLYWPD
jgi:S-layer family protein